jgi:hypothetical protein
MATASDSNATVSALASPSGVQASEASGVYSSIAALGLGASNKTDGQDNSTAISIASKNATKSATASGSGGIRGVAVDIALAQAGFSLGLVGVACAVLA